MKDTRITNKLNRDYWSGKLADIPNYHLGQNTEGANKERYDVHTLAFSDQLNDDLIKAGKSNDLSIYKLLATALAVLINKYSSGRCKIYIATPPFKNEDHPSDEESLIYLNVEFDASETVRELLKKVHEQTNEIFQHQSFDFDDLLHHLYEMGTVDNDQLFQVALNYSNVNAGSPWFDKVNLAFDIIRHQDQFSLVTKYNTTLFNKEYINQISAHYGKLLADIVVDINMSLDQLEVLTGPERDKILLEFNDTQVDYPGDSTIAQLFEEQAEKTPDNIALVFGEKRLTYQELNHKANQLAHYLQENCNIQPDDLVVGLLNSSDLYIVTLLGILKSGAGYVPVDTALPRERVSFMLNDLNAKAVITTYDHIFELDGYKGKLISLDIQEDIFETNHSNPVNETTSQDTAYVMYTSGTTGQPKGVIVKQQNVVRLVKNTNFVALDNTSKLLMTGAISFDASTYEVWGMLLNGGELHLLSREELINTETLRPYVLEEKITHMWFTSSWFNQLVNTSIELFKNLQYLVVGGEKISAPHINKILETYPTVNIRNGYGPTENTTFSTYYEIKEEQTSTSIIGKPLANSKAVILDETRKLVPIGVEGEIYLGGDGLAKGYLNQDELTNGKFIQDPYNPEIRLYRSGDRGMWLPDGNIVFLGRNDKQVKLRGYRIELEEVETALSNLPDIKQALIIHKPEDEGHLIAYIISDRLLEELDLKNTLKKVLPEYMIPSHFVAIDDIPLTTNGKLDTAALPDPLSAILKASEYVPPATEVEQKLVGIWKAIFSLTQVSVLDNFFELGGHSITAIKMLHRVHKEISTEAQINDIFSYPTIRQLGERIEKMASEVSKHIPVAEPKEYYETSYSQKRFWLAEQTGEGYVGYNVPSVYIFSALNVEAFEKAIEALIERHEILRTTFTEVDGILMQKIHDASEYGFKIDHVDLSNHGHAERRAKEITYEEVKKPIDLEKGPLLKAKLFKIDGHRHLFYALTHHIISDSESLSVVLRELLALYSAFSKQGSNPLRPLRIQYKDFAEWQNKLIRDESKDSLKKYWHQQMNFGQVPELNFPIDYDRTAGTIPEGDSVRENIDETLQQSLDDFSNRNHTSLFVTLLTAYYLLLHRYTGKEDIIVGSPVAGRTHADLEDQIGCYINMLPLRAEFNAQDTITEVLERVNTMTIAAIGNQEYPFELLVDDLQIAPLKSGALVFDTSFSVQVGEFDEVETVTNLEAQSLDSNYRVVHVDLLLQAWRFGKSVLLCFDYNASLFKRETIELVKDRYMDVLRQMITNENLKVIDISFGNDNGKVNENELEIDLNF